MLGAPDNCKKCTLADNRRRIVNGQLIPGSKIFIVGQSPGYTEELLGEPFVGDSGKELNMLLQRVDLNRDEISISNACRCRPLSEEHKVEVEIKNEEIHACRPYLVEEINYVKPNVIVCLGNIALKSILGLKGVTDLRGVFYWSEEFQCKVIASLHPANVLRQWEMTPLLEWDLQKAKDGSQNKEMPVPKKGHYKVAKTLEQFDELLGLLEKSKEFVIDLETSSFDFINGKILCVGFSTKPYSGHVLPIHGQHISKMWTDKDLEYIRGELDHILSDRSRLKILHNVGFDWKFLKSFDIDMKGPFFDTMVAYFLCNENLPKSLESLARTHTDLGCYERVVKRYVPSKTKGSFAIIPNKVLWSYAARDVDCEYRMFKMLKPKIRREGVEKLFYEVLMPLTTVLAETERRGVLINRSKLEKASKVLKKSIEEAREKLYKDTGHEFNPNSPLQIAKILFHEKHLRPWKKTKSGAWSTDHDVLESFVSKSSFAKLLLDYRSIQKLKSTYVDGSDGNGGILARLDENDRVHPNYQITGAETGRLSCRRPNLQNIPRQPVEIRNMFVAPKGWKILEADFASAELWCLACYADSDKLKKRLASGKFHVDTAVVMGMKRKKEDVTKEDKIRSKALIFGLIYGGSEEGLAESIGLPKREVSIFIRKWFDEYPKTKEWMDQQREDARTKGFVKSFFGRKRRFYGLEYVNKATLAKVERDAMNSPIQGLVSDITSAATVRIAGRLGENSFKAGLIMTLHDSIFFEVPKEELKEVREIVKEEMTAYVPEMGVRMKVDIKVGLCWDDYG